MTRLKCPVCDLEWSTLNGAAPLITCPRCLTAVSNPNAASHATSPPPLPMRVLPLEHEVKRDSRAGTVGFIVVAGVIIVGMFGVLVAGAEGAGTGKIVVLTMAVVTLAAVIATAVAA